MRSHGYTVPMISSAEAGDSNGSAPGTTIDEPLDVAISERYLQYALSTIMNRALPDVRDGLKPVHRRILYAMRELKLDPGGRFRKCSKISGDVMGNYHPHGDQAIYDALARLAQDFVIRYPLVDGQGNFGNIDGDNPAAGRYTEARLTEASMALMDGLAEDAVDFRDNYDGTLTEPVVLPATFPNILANGSSGIAVGMATSIPPHNLGELCDAALHLIKAPAARDDTLLGIVPAPDFPTGGILVEPRESIAEAYRTGRGSFRLRARWHVEKLSRGQWQAVVTEIPYQVQKSRLIEKIADLVQDKKVPLLADIRDESAEDVRLVLEPRAKSVDADLMMELLFRQSDLEVRIGLNMNVLIDGQTPKVCSLKEVLKAFLDHRREVLLRRSRFRHKKIDHRLHVLEGYMTAFLNLDEVIRIIRTEDEPKPVLMKAFSLTDEQAEAILNMRLRALRRLEEIELRSEQQALMDERVELEDLMSDESLQWARISDELKETRRKFGKDSPGGARRTDLAEAPEVDLSQPESMVEREPVTVVCSSMGWIRMIKGHLDPDHQLKYRDGDEGKFFLHAQTTDRLIVVGSNGRFYTIACADLPSGRGMGEPIRLMINLENEAEVVEIIVHAGGRKFLIASSDGNGFVVEEDSVLTQRRAGKVVQVVGKDATTIACRVVEGTHIATVSDARRLLVYPLQELPELNRGKGVRLQAMKVRGKDCRLSDVITLDPKTGLQWRDPAGRLRTEKNLDTWIGSRAKAGNAPPRGFPQNNRFS